MRSESFFPYAGHRRQFAHLKWCNETTGIRTLSTQGTFTSDSPFGLVCFHTFLKQTKPPGQVYAVRTTTCFRVVLHETATDQEKKKKSTRKKKTWLENRNHFLSLVRWTVCLRSLCKLTCQPEHTTTLAISSNDLKVVLPRHDEDSRAACSNWSLWLLHQRKPNKNIRLKIF